MWIKPPSGRHLRPSPREARCKAIQLHPEPAFSMGVTGLRKKSIRQTLTNRPSNRGRDMSILTPQEKSFLDVFLHEATTSPFSGPATKVLHAIGVEYRDISYLAWAYNKEVPQTSFGWGHAAEVAPP